ncbi:MAG: hypothetical protein OEY49_15590 [Candidatus Heimdallarchaeota archaeon]|nr:hypothetical protein [Candidatus Heimdallarchaeota archaeon]
MQAYIIHQNLTVTEYKHSRFTVINLDEVDVINIKKIVPKRYKLLQSTEFLIFVLILFILFTDYLIPSVDKTFLIIFSLAILIGVRIIRQNKIPNEYLLSFILSNERVNFVMNDDDSSTIINLLKEYQELTSGYNPDTFINFSS